MNSKLREIASGSAGTYFIVTVNNGTETIETPSKLRLFFINTEKGPVNTMVIFQKGDETGFTSIFGKSSRIQEKRGNYSISSCIEGLRSGPIAVINLRKFEDIDTIGVVGINANNAGDPIEGKKNIPYTGVFNVNSFWTIKPSSICDQLTTNQLLNFANIGNADASIFVVVSTDRYKNLTSEGNLSLANCSLEIDEYPGLDFEMQLKNTFVDVYVFNQTFDITSSTNKYYGHLFDNDGNIAMEDLAELTTISEAGFNRIVTGSMIPMLKNESDEDISIDTILNSVFAETGIIGYINDDMLELDNKNTLDTDCSTFFNPDGTKKITGSTTMLSHVMPDTISVMDIDYPPLPQEVIPITANKINFETVRISDTEFVAVLEQGVKVGDTFIGVNGATVEVQGIEILQEGAPVQTLP